MTKVLFITDKFMVAGTETFIMNVVRASDKDCFHYDFLIFYEGMNAYIEEAEAMGCHFHRLKSRRESPIQYYRQLNNFFCEHQGEYNAVHWCGGDISSIAPLFYAYKYKVPVRIVHSHSSSCDGLHTNILHRINRNFLRFLCTDNFACSTLAAKFFFPYGRSVIIKNGIDVAKYAFDETVREKMREELGITPSDYVIGHIGRFVGVKNHKFLIDVFKKLQVSLPESKLLLVGIGELMGNIKIQVHDSGLDNRVLFLGQRNDVNRLMQAMDAFVMPSLYEGLPFVLVEAQAASLPCIISSTINRDVKISPLVAFEELSEGSGKWVEKIIEIRNNHIRTNMECYVVESGFSVKDTVYYLESIYSKKIEK